MTAWSWDRRIPGSQAQRQAAVAILVSCLRDEASTEYGLIAETIEHPLHPHATVM